MQNQPKQLEELVEGTRCSPEVIALAQRLDKGHGRPGFCFLIVPGWHWHLTAATLPKQL